MAGLPPALAQQLQEVIQAWGQNQTQFSDWLGGTVTGGPNCDGQYPLTNSLGQVTVLACPAALVDTITGPAAQAEVARLAAQASADLATASATAADASKILSDAAKTAAVEARVLAQTAQSHSATHEANTRYWAERGAANAAVSTSDRVIVQALANTTANAANTAVASASSAANSANLAATFNPALFANVGHTHNANAIVAGTLATARLPAFTGDVTKPSGSAAQTLATVNANVGSFGSATASPVITVDGKGRITAVSIANVAPSWTSITSKPTTVAGYGITDLLTSITELDSAKLTGTIDVARLPSTVFQAPIVAASNIASLTTAQQAEVRIGSTIVTSDGVFWSYLGGTKTLQASYRAMADTTPDYGSIANKPSTFTPSAHTQDWTTITARPTTLAGFGITDGATNLNATIGTGSGQFSNALSITPSTHATSRRAAISVDDWLILQDSAGSGTKDFGLYSVALGGFPISITTNGRVTLGYGFSNRPSFNGNTPWDSGNFTPALYATLANPTFTGTVTAPAISATGTIYSAGNLTTNGNMIVGGSQVEMGAVGGAVSTLIRRGSMELREATPYIDLSRDSAADWHARIASTSNGYMTLSSKGGVYLDAQGGHVYSVSNDGQQAGKLLTEGGTQQVVTKQLAVTSFGGWASGIGTSLEVVASSGATQPAFMKFHRPGAFGAAFGLGTDNEFRVGGWSYGDASWRVWTERLISFDVAASGDTAIKRDGGGNAFSTNICTTALAGNGLRLWNGDSGFSIYMSDEANSTWGGRPANSNAYDYNMYFRMNGAGRGWAFYNGGVKAKIDGNGEATFVGTVKSNGWFYTYGGGGLYDATTGQGIRSVGSSGHPYGTMGVYGGGSNGWQGINLRNDGVLTWMCNADNVGLHHSGNSWLINGNVAGDFTFRGNVTAFSDLRLKTDARPIPDLQSRRDNLAAAAIMYEREGRTRIGYGAQTVRETNPEFVHEADDAMKIATGTGTLSVDYGETTAVLAVASKLTDDRVAVLEAEVSRLADIIKAIIGEQ